MALGSNLGDRSANLLHALGALRSSDGVELRAASRVYETAPVGPVEQGPFLNAVVRVASRPGPRELLRVLMRIERSMGRVRRERWGPRTIDLDLILFGREVLDAGELVLPHPRMHERAFVLRPMCDLDADRVHPTLGVTMGQLLASLPDEPVEPAWVEGWPAGPAEAG